MGIKSKVIKPFARLITKKIDAMKSNAVADQNKIMLQLVTKAQETKIGSDRNFKIIKNHSDFAEVNPILDYEGIKHYIDLIKSGHSNVLWPGIPKYFAKTSGTTSGVKYIPLTKDSMPNHFNSARNAMFNYFIKTGKGDFFDGKMIFLSGSPKLDLSNTVPTGRLSGIVNHEVPSWLKRNQLPSFETNCIEDWETKLDQIVEETVGQDLRLISGIPPWVQMYLERLLLKTGKSTILDVFPNLSMFVYGGVNFDPYRASLEKLFGAKIPSVETFPASEGFFAFQDVQGDPSLLLNTNDGIFFEFVPSDEISQPKPTRLTLNDVELNKPYALIISNNAGLWSYNIGDIVTFTSIRPYKIVFSGRVSHYLSAFGEHVIAKEVEDALQSTLQKFPAEVNEFTVAPQVNPEQGLPYHEWFIEFESVPLNLDGFKAELDAQLTKNNIYYNDLIVGGVLRPLELTILPKGSFIDYMRSKGKLGGQNKVPRITNDRMIADQLTKSN